MVAASTHHFPDDGNPCLSNARFCDLPILTLLNRFEQDAGDARDWLVQHGLIDQQNRLAFRLR